jgi:hypothetical protein
MHRAPLHHKEKNVERKKERKNEIFVVLGWAFWYTK